MKESNNNHTQFRNAPLVSIAIDRRVLESVVVNADAVHAVATRRVATSNRTAVSFAIVAKDLVAVTAKFKVTKTILYSTRI